MSNEMNRVEVNHDMPEDPFIGSFICAMPDETADYMLVEMTAYEMRGKLAKKRSDGRGGWHTANCESSNLLEALREHVEKGDMVDVINLAAMILARQKLWGKSA